MGAIQFLTTDKIFNVLQIKKGLVTYKSYVEAMELLRLGRGYMQYDAT
jgi:hypothetical protein